MGEVIFLKQILLEKEKELVQLKDRCQKLEEENKILTSMKKTNIEKNSETEMIEKLQQAYNNLLITHAKVKDEKLKLQEELNNTQEQLEFYKKEFMNKKGMRTLQEVKEQLELEYLKKHPGASLINPNFDPINGYDEID
ncbi:hypothetical protein HELRODRAFT_162033 [Helobdella robusta]|uniref:Uncharacterized protein n=1 Tax=Helobdella robusta TaxID=6412 RepID=T1ES60_HELRO|nr:hypothetical protein HELRODRAFT_162033 [Helobdella robusta]ESN98601.1 hypothetical protein HELRODRAFT_162033 [Helobdella robusta]